MNVSCLRTRNSGRSPLISLSQSSGINFGTHASMGRSQSMFWNVGVCCETYHPKCSHARSPSPCLQRQPGGSPGSQVSQPAPSQRGPRRRVSVPSLGPPADPCPPRVAVGTCHQTACLLARRIGSSECIFEELQSYDCVERNLARVGEAQAMLITVSGTEDRDVWWC